MRYLLLNRLADIGDYVYCVSVTAHTVAFDRNVFIFLDPSQPSLISTLILLYG